METLLLRDTAFDAGRISNKTKSYIHGTYRWGKVGNEEQQKAKERTTQAPQGLGTEGTLCVPVNWLDHGRTLREQGVEEHETLLLRRKFFYSDQNVDSRDPVQLNLLYVQVWRGFAWGGGGRERGRKQWGGGVPAPNTTPAALCSPGAR